MRAIPVSSTDPVQLVCFHPVQEAKLRRGEDVEQKELNRVICIALDELQLGIPLHFNNEQRSRMYDIIEKAVRANDPTTSAMATALTSRDTTGPGEGWIASRFYWLEPNEDDMSVESILSLTDRAIKTYDFCGLVIDPWNEIDHNRPTGASETDYTSKALTMLRRFARTRNIYLYIITHPQKLYRDKNGETPVPRPYDISGSAHWYNKADNCFTVYRNDDNSVSVYIHKIKFKIRGKTGKVDFYYDKPTGIYTEFVKTYGFSTDETNRY